MTRSRFSFLTLFVIALTAAFVAAVAMRAQRYNAALATTASASAEHVDTPALDPSVRALSPEATGTIVPLGADGARASSGRATASQTSTAVTRAQRYRELLSQPVSGVAVAQVAAAPVKPAPPPHITMAPTKTVAPPALVQRVVQPVSNVLSGSSSSSQPGGKPTGREPGKPGIDPNDPTSDTKPPQLLGIEFNPPQVHDGEDGILYVTAIDDISGIRGISGTLTSPSGKALQGFSCQKEGEGSNRYIGRVTIPKDAEEGQWRVNFISLSDNASNTANLHYNQGGIPSTAVLRVISNRPDSTPPTLRRVWLERRQMKSGERNNVFLEADDDKSGVKFASGVFQSPAKFARLSFGCQKGDIDTQWTCTLNTPATLDCGDWQLEQVQLQDGANNMATVRQDNPIVGQVKLGIVSDSCDSTPPVLQSLLLDVHVVSNQGGAVNLTANVTDDMSGIYGVMAQATGPGQGSGRWFPFAGTPEQPNLWTGRFEVPPNAGKGTWRIAFVQVIDKANNIKLYTQADPQLANATFEVK